VLSLRDAFELGTQDLRARGEEVYEAIKDRAAVRSLILALRLLAVEGWDLAALRLTCLEGHTYEAHTGRWRADALIALWNLHPDLCVVPPPHHEGVRGTVRQVTDRG
jgi:hypothetical protein